MRRTAAVLAAGATALVAVWRATRERSRERVDLYFADGSMLSLDEGSEPASRLLPLAREVLAAAE